MWKGSAFGGIKGRSELPGLVDAYLTGTLQIEPFISTTFVLADLQAAMDQVGKSIRSVVHMH